MNTKICFWTIIGLVIASTVFSQEIVTQGRYSLKTTKQEKPLVMRVDIDAVATNYLAKFEVQRKVEDKTGEMELVVYNKDSNRKIRVRTLLFPSVTEAENGVLSQLNSVSVIFTSGSPSGATIGDNSWFHTTSGTGSTTVTFIRRNVVVSVFAQQEANSADTLARELDQDILAGNNGVELSGSE